ncbi:MAG: TonB-dependent receptor [Lysobacterales bacterium]
MKIPRCCALAAAFVVAFPVGLLAASSDPSLSDAELDAAAGGGRPAAQAQIVVTASGHAESVDASLATVSVIERAEIERLQPPDLLSLLRLQAGVDIARTGGAGQATSVFLRGSNSNHVLVLIDGVRVSSTLSGAFDFAHLPISQIERIEIVRGPRAAIWGSEAIGGVIQIFTRAPERFAARLGYGSHDASTGNASFALRGDAGMIGASLGQDRSDGISAQNPAGFSFDPDRDRYRNRHASLHAETQLGGQTVSLRALRTEAEVEFDQGRTRVDDSSAALAVAGELGRHWNHRLTLAATGNDLATPVFFSRFESRRQTLDWHHQWAPAAGSEWQFGISAAHERGRDIETFAGSASIRRSRDNGGVYLGYRRALGQHDLEATLRRDENSEFDGETTAQLAWGWQLFDALRFSANYGEGFRAPNLNEQFSPGFGGLFNGNPDLDPEHSRSVELGLRWQAGARQSLAMHAFRTRIRDLISFTGGETFQAENIDRARIDGIELEHQWQGHGLSWQNNLTVQNPENRATGATLLRRPKQKLAGSLDYGLGGGWSAGGDWLIASRRQDFGAGLPGYGVLNLHAAYALDSHWRIEARLDNLFDRRYELAHGFNTPDRSLLVALAAAF